MPLTTQELLRFSAEEDTLDLEVREERRKREAKEAQQVETAAADVGLLETLGEALPFGLVRGVGSALGRTYQTADTLLGDLLPDLDDPNLFGENETTFGRLSQGFFEFLVGFATPGVGGLAVGNRVLRLAKTIKVPGAATLAGSRIGRDVVGGAVTDAVLAQEGDGRFSDILNNTFVANPLTEWLASDPDDGAAEAKIKSVLEGAMIGPLADGFISLMKAARKSLRPGAPIEEVAEEARKVGATPEGQKIVDDAAKAATKEIDDEFAEAITRRRDEAGIEAPTEPVGGEVFRAPESTKALVDDFKRELQVQSSSRSGTARTLPKGYDTWEEFRKFVQKKDLNLLGMEEDWSTMIRVIQRSLRDPLGDPSIRATIPDEEYLARVAKRKEDLASTFNSSPEALDSQLGLAKANVEEADEILGVAEIVLESYAKEMRGRMDTYLNELNTQGFVNPDTMHLYEIGHLKTARLIAGVGGVRGAFGRGLRRRQLNLFDPNLSQKLIDGDPRAIKDAIKQAQHLRQTLGGPNTRPDGYVSLIHHMLNGTGKATTKIPVEYFLNSLLSSPKTWAVNGLSGAIWSAFRPLEMMYGAALARDSREFRVAALNYVGMWRNLRESFRAGREAFSQIDNKLTGNVRPEFGDSGQPRAFSGENFGLSGRVDSKGNPLPDSVYAGMVDTIGRVINFPSAVLVGTDAFFTNLTYRAHVWARYADNALDGTDMHWSQVAEAAEKKLEETIVDGHAFSRSALYNKLKRDSFPTHDASGTQIRTKAKQAQLAREKADEILASDEGLLRMDISSEALADARDVTLTKRVGVARHKGERTGAIEDVTATVSAGLQKHPLLKFFIPFINTPFNIAQAGFERAGGLDQLVGAAQYISTVALDRDLRRLAQSQSRFARDLAAGGRRKADALGRMATGVGIWSFVFSQASEGTITGAGPKDLEQRRILEASGWLPYSIKIGDSYVQYQRLDPIATMMGIAADAVTYGKYSLEDDIPVIEQMTSGMVVAMVNNVVNKTYMEGVRNIVEVLSDPERNFGPGLQKLLSAAVPTGVGQAASLVATGNPVDPHIREVRNLMDRAMVKLPYYGEGLDPVRNFLGEPVKKMQSLGSDIHPVANMFVPIAYTSAKDKFVEKEILAIGRTLEPPRARYGAVDLREFINGRGQSAYDRRLELRQEIDIRGKPLRAALRDLFRAPRYQSLPTDDAPGLRNLRLDAVQALIRQYDHRAIELMRAEYQDVDYALTRQLEENRLRRRQAIR